MKKATLHIALLVLTMIFFDQRILIAATTYTAASNSATDVQAAINSASSGDIVMVPEGTGSVTWSTTVTIANKTIFLVGPGQSKLTIYSGAAKPLMLSTSGTGTNGSRVSGFSFSFSLVAIDVYASGQYAPQNWRIDHCAFNSTVALANAVRTFGNSVSLVYGLIDNCSFYNSRVAVMGEIGTTGNYSWSQPLDLGKEKSVYIEDCSFTKSPDGIDALDSNYGGRFVFRFNIVTGNDVELHSLQADNTRATRSWEIYSNTFTVTTGLWVVTRMRGGTGVAFNNTWGDGITLYKMPLDNRRSCEDLGAWNKCDGNSWIDGNASAGYPCRDQIGRSTDAYLWDYSSAAPTQELAPAYIWGNKHGNAEIPAYAFASCTANIAHVQENRDFYNYNSSFNGTSGIGVGSLANRPTTCTAGVAYWATDQGSWNQKTGGSQGQLYKCISTNNWSTYYTPYTYPHPLRKPQPPAWK